MIPLDDRGLTLGDGLFETLLAKDGVLIHLGPHLARMTSGCEVLGLTPPDPKEAERLMIDALVAAGLQAARAAVRLTLTAGSGDRGLDRPMTVRPRLFATAAACPRPNGPVALSTSTIRRNADSPAAYLKTLAYLDNVLARRAARAIGADEALMLNTRGEVACATAANIFWILGGRLVTPALSCGILPGVTRAAVMAAAAARGIEVVETAQSVESLSEAQAMFLTNSLVGIREVSSFNGLPLGASRLVQELATSVG